MKDVILISEIFGPTVQGEGPLVGRPTVFVRTGGCDYRCAWCDTLYAVLPEHRGEWVLMTPAEIETRIDELTGDKPVLLTLSGGNPALQPLAPLIELGHAKGHTFALETQGSVPAPWFTELGWLILSPKPPFQPVRIRVVIPLSFRILSNSVLKKRSCAYDCITGSLAAGATCISHFESVGPRVE